MKLFYEEKLLIKEIKDHQILVLALGEWNAQFNAAKQGNKDEISIGNESGLVGKICGTPPCFL